MRDLAYVRSNPFPSLDKDGPGEQLGAYQQALDLFGNPDHPVVLTVPAGAGSGKTRTLVATIIGLLRLGTPPEWIESISFTNASADDFQGKLIENLVKLSGEGQEDFPLSNLGFGTIHKHAIDLLSKLEPHVGGVAYYFEDAGNMAGSDGTGEEESRENALRLGLYASIYYGDDEGLDLIERLRPYMERESGSPETRWVIEGFEHESHRDNAVEHIGNEVMSEAGLGAFTSLDNASPDYCVAVATDALLRLARHTQDYSYKEKREQFGIPGVLFVDEGQDLDLIQVLYLRALALNGTSIMIVGDPRQTLYAFRNSVSDWPFDREFLAAMFSGIGVATYISDHPLRTNYRSRKPIIEFSEDASDIVVEKSETVKSTKVSAIQDPPESVKRSHYAPGGTEPQEADKRASSVRLFNGAPTKDLDFLTSKGRQSQTSQPSSGPLARLARHQQKVSDELSEDVIKSAKSKASNLQIPSLCGGASQSEIERSIQNLYERACKGESVCILTRNGVKPDDIEYLKTILRKKVPDIDEADKLSINKINSDKNAPLAPIWFLTQDELVTQEVPFSSVLFAAAIHYFMSFDMEQADQLKLEGLKDIKYVTSMQSPEDVLERLRSESAPRSIALEIEPYIDAVRDNAIEFFPGSSKERIEASRGFLTERCVEFILSVLSHYAYDYWRNAGGRYDRIPCRFQSCATERNQGRGQLQLKDLQETKRFFQAFWESLVRTPFEIDDSDRQAIAQMGLTPEYVDFTTSLISFNKDLLIWKDNVRNQSRSLDAGVKSFQDEFIEQREMIHEQFSKIYHHKTRTYLRDVSRAVGRIIRRNTGASMDPNIALIAAYEEFGKARRKARTSTWRKVGRKGTEYNGLLEDLKKGIRDIDVQSKSGNKQAFSSAKTIIHMGTIFSAKGLEWDHVLVFFPPAPTGRRASQTSLRSIRDLLYVASTRAARTLTMILGSDKNYKDIESNTPTTIAKHAINDLGRRQDLFNRPIQLEDLTGQEQAPESEQVVEVETSHTELEDAQSCRVHHHTKYERSLSSMVPLTTPSYSFYFHTTMSSICAALIGQRLEIPEDPIIPIARSIEQLCHRQHLTESIAYDVLFDNCSGSVNELMQSMIPLHQLASGDRYYALMEYYSTQFVKQLASILSGSSLFQNLILASGKPDHRIFIEKPIRDVLTGASPHGTGLRYYPIIGLPDLKISGPEISYVADYKTVDASGDEAQPLDEQTINHISAKTEAQINLYQHINSEEKANRSLSEVIYVPNITVFDSSDVPSEPPPLPIFNNSPRYRVTSHLKAATVLWSDSLDELAFEETVKSIQLLRFVFTRHQDSFDARTMEPAPMIGDNQSIEVTPDICRQCPSAVHCPSKKIREKDDWS